MLAPPNNKPPSQFSSNSRLGSTNLSQVQQPWIQNQPNPFSGNQQNMNQPTQNPYKKQTSIPSTGPNLSNNPLTPKRPQPTAIFFQDQPKPAADNSPYKGPSYNGMPPGQPPREGSRSIAYDPMAQNGAKQGTQQPNIFSMQSPKNRGPSDAPPQQFQSGHSLLQQPSYNSIGSNKSYSNNYPQKSMTPGTAGPTRQQSGTNPFNGKDAGKQGILQSNAGRNQYQGQPSPKASKNRVPVEDPEVSKYKQDYEKWRYHAERPMHKAGERKAIPILSPLTNFKQSCLATPNHTTEKLVIPWDHNNLNFVYNSKELINNGKLPIKEIETRVTALCKDSSWNPVGKCEVCLITFTVWVLFVVVLTIFLLYLWDDAWGLFGKAWVPLVGGLIAIIFGVILLYGCKIYSDKLSWRKRLLMYKVLKNIEEKELKDTGLGLRPGKDGAWIEFGTLETINKFIPRDDFLTPLELPPGSIAVAKPTPPPSMQVSPMNSRPMTPRRASIYSAKGGTPRSARLTNDPYSSTPTNSQRLGRIQFSTPLIEQNNPHHTTVVLQPSSKPQIPDIIRIKPKKMRKTLEIQRYVPVRFGNEELLPWDEITKRVIPSPRASTISPRGEGPKTPRQQQFINRVTMHRQGQDLAQIPPVEYAMYDSVKPPQEIIYDPTKSINLLVDNAENDI